MIKITPENKKKIAEKIFKVYCALNEYPEVETLKRFTQKATKENIDINQYIINTVVLPANYMSIIEREFTK